MSTYSIKSKSNVLQSNDLKISEVNENLFEAKFADSFSDTTNLPQMPPPLSSGSKKDIQSPTSPMHQQLLNAPKAAPTGHRRNMSDTSAFNKY